MFAIFLYRSAPLSRMGSNESHMLTIGCRQNHGFGIDSACNLVLVIRDVDEAIEIDDPLRLCSSMDCMTANSVT